MGLAVPNLMNIAILLVVQVIVMLKFTTHIHVLHSVLSDGHMLFRAQKLFRAHTTSISELQVMTTDFSIL